MKAAWLIAAIALGAARPHTDRERVERLLDVAAPMEGEDREPGAQRKAREELVRMGRRAVPYLANHLGSKAMYEGRAVYSLLRRIGAPGVPLLAGALASPDEVRRHAAVMVVSAIRDPVVWPVLTRMLDDPFAKVRAQAALGCAYQLDPMGVPLICTVLARRDEDAEVLLASARALRWAAYKMPWITVPPGTTRRLTELLDHAHFGVREAAAMALMELGAASLPELAARIRRGLAAPPAGPPVWSAVLALGTVLGERPAARTTAYTELHEGLLAHADPMVRAPAAEALWAFGPEGRTRALARLAVEGHPTVRRKLMSVISTRPVPRPDGL